MDGMEDRTYDQALKDKSFELEVMDDLMSIDLECLYREQRKLEEKRAKAIERIARDDFLITLCEIIEKKSRWEG